MKHTLRRFTPVAWIVLAWIGVWLTANRYVPDGHTLWGELIAFLDRFTFKAFGGFPAAQAFVAGIIRLVHLGTSWSFAMFATWASFFVPLGFVARIASRARLRSGATDPLDRVRAWTLAHPGWTQVLLALLPALSGVAMHKAFRRIFDEGEITFAQILPVALVSAGAQFAAARAVVRALLAPTLDPAEADARIEIGPDEIVFDAVAVTREARAAVGGLAALSVAMVVWIAALPIATLFRDPRLFAAVAAYMAIAGITATVFRIASRVAVGVDGVLVKGTSRTRFYAYRDLDSARVANGDLELLRRGSVVVRLQLHGADAVRRDAVLARIQENLERVKRGEHAVAAQLVSSSSKDQLARVAAGGADYRAASLSREALWALIEGPAVGSEARRAAAEALAKTNDVAERARLRVAAEHCADPSVRIALVELAEGVAREGDPEAEARAAASRASGA
jgi:hypothetical protein